MGGQGLLKMIPRRRAKMNLFQNVSMITFEMLNELFTKC